jgi:urease accessory protein
MNFMPAREMALPAQRAVGGLRLTFRVVAGRARVEVLAQAGCLKARLPRPVAAGTLEAVCMNISGGIAGGDVLETDINLGPGADVCVATGAAERVYRAIAGPARVGTCIAVGDGASLAYLPQETILFDGFALARRLEVNLAPTATYLGIESLVFGRQAMGEVVRSGHLRDRIVLIRDGKTVWQDLTRLDGDIDAQLQRRGVAAGAMAVAGIVLAAPGAADLLPALREALRGANAGASALDRDLVFVRILAPSAHLLRQRVFAGLDICRGGRALPRVWQG